MKIFLSTTYSDFCDQDYHVKNEYKTFFENLLSKIREKGHKCYLAMEREKWGYEFLNCEESVVADFNAIKEADLTIMLLHYPISGGAHIELGWLSALKRPVQIFLQKDGKFSPVVKGISVLTNANFIEYEKYDESLLNKILSLI